MERRGTGTRKGDERKGRWGLGSGETRQRVIGTSHSKAGGANPPTVTPAISMSMTMRPLSLPSPGDQLGARPASIVPCVSQERSLASSVLECREVVAENRGLQWGAQCEAPDIRWGPVFLFHFFMSSL